MEEKVKKTNKPLIGVIIGIALVIIIAIILLVKGCTKENIYTIRFDSNGGSSVGTLEVKENKTISKPADPEREGYKFVGWYYLDRLFDFNKKITKDMVLEARWEKLDDEDDEIKVSNVKLKESSLTLKVNETATLEVVISPTNATNKEVIWTSSDPKVATVDENGKITALKEGKVTITVKTKDGNYEAKCTITVSADKVEDNKNNNKNVSVTSVTLTGPSEVYEKGTIQLTAKVLPENATNKKVSFKSSNTSIATVDNNGKVTGVKEGRVTITVTTDDGKMTATYQVTVKKKASEQTTVPVASVTLTGPSEVYEKETIQLTAKVLPENATNKKVSFKSSNTSIATVDNNGKVTGVKEGSVTITVTTDDGKMTATYQVTVKKKTSEQTTVPVTSVTLTGDSEVYESESIQLTAKVLPENATNKKVSFKSSNTSIATVDNNGKVTGVKEGQVTITVTTDDGKKTATHQVTVKKKDTSVHVTEVKINGNQNLSMYVKDEIVLSVTVLPENATNKKVTFQSSNAGIATVDENGRVRAVTAGNVTITVTTEDGKKTATVTIEVKEHVYEVTLTGLKQKLQPIYQYEITEVRFDNNPISFTKLKFKNGREATKTVAAEWVEDENLKEVTLVLSNGEEVQARIKYASRDI